MHLKLVPSLVVLTALAGCSSPNRNGATPASGGTTSNGGISGTGGVVSGEGGSMGTGGNNSGGSGGNTIGSTGGAGGGTSGGTTPQGGSLGSGGADSSGGAVRTGGVVGSGGVSVGSGGAGGTVTGGAPAKGGSGAGGTAVTGGTIVTGGTTTNPSTGGVTGPVGPTGPCDIYESGGTPCAAAHATARSLYAAYKGPLYQVQRTSDKATKDIMVGDGGFADMAAQDAFCTGGCTIPIIYDQSGNGNHLRVTWWAYWLRNGAKPANANGQKIKVGGHTVSGIMQTAFSLDVGYRTGVQLAGKAAVTKGSTTVTFTSPQTLPANTPLFFASNTTDCPADSWPNNCKFKAFWTAADISNATTVTLKNAYDGTASASTDVWNHATKGMPVGDESEAMYAVLDAKRYSSNCCFSYGNGELSGWDEGNATMECIYFGNCSQFGQNGGGNGPWLGADLENGMFEGYENGSTKVSSNTSITGMDYVTTMVKGPTAKECPASLVSSGCFGLKAGNSQNGKLEWKFSAPNKGLGPRPPGYTPQKKQGAIILATGGDGSNGGTGTWFEGAITKGTPSDATDDAVQANIVAAGYGK